MNIHPQTEFRNHTLIVTVSSDDGRPVLDGRAYESLARIFHEAAIEDDVRVVVLRGLAGCFCLGGDFSEFLDATKHQRLIAAVTDMFRTLATFPKPVLACVDGDAVGVGCTILFHCDMVIASDESTFRVPFVDFGLVPDAATSILAPQKLGYAGAFRFFCLGDTLRAADARMLGLVTEVVVGDVEQAALGRARQLAKKPVAALLQTRDLLKGDTGALCDRIDQEISLFQQALQDDTTLRRLQRIARLAA
ncbi:enoyl-CoA hydratase/isomerase family protein [Mesorhizobium sp.]|uniref:enoyl-CoA hydratase/isomerase family protein n=1 Tax=Mesorhizobium sp. TaxID=1871066 RepID=UPI000FE5E0DC|nr:enoyl-CoA hydratase/isomerase family protein [Mesorhizobium sp.]RWI15415.1 MAG: enoyl-CoA hydratase/isomerase family protein [Mesorhizobium sp.]RWK46771.1 MAG: enoyl-CoA hydratase/isomerase family protein [Mesorhizobium sp.]RWK93537.1 MAG: enoyl-CoA hydratase/isomerase family protein [Mesorhizobium sp.]TIQ28347.1 MAG: enoyl-CoA hydratase/isomerase family protein [Mesorhizobium sp.]TJW52734.1 MAG: enoyl-CoA hydratase/isomerase family protein [Mesorhizobium sp.]